VKRQKKIARERAIFFSVLLWMSMH